MTLPLITLIILPPFIFCFSTSNFKTQVILLRVHHTLLTVKTVPNCKQWKQQAGLPPGDTGWDCGWNVGPPVLHPILPDCEVGDSDVRFKNPLVLLSDNPKDGWSMVPSQPGSWSHPYPYIGLASDFHSLSQTSRNQFLAEIGVEAVSVSTVYPEQNVCIIDLKI